VTPLGHITALAGIAVLVLTFLTGHTGAQAVWESKIVALNGTTTTSTAPTTSEKTYTKADLAKHATVKSCWSAIDGVVYDLTKWVSRHPGGQSVILGICGRDGSAAFNGQHAGGRKPAEELAKYRVGSLG
jgi:cytochrome b involved in lipid metabolism